MLKLVETVEEARENVLSFFSDPERYGGHLWNRPSNVKAWYAVRTPNGWAFGPSRIVGHQRKDLQHYLENTEERREAGDYADGGRTENALQWISEPMTGRKLDDAMKSLTEWLGAQDAVLNSLARISYLGETNSTVSPDKPSTEETLRRRLVKEGQSEERFVKRRYRDTTVREACIEEHGLGCKACGMEFGSVFGDDFFGLIEVHHTTPIATADSGGFEIDPKKDCLPLCPNCHAMAHFRMPAGECRTIKDLRKIIDRRNRPKNN